MGQVISRKPIPKGCFLWTLPVRSGVLEGSIMGPVTFLVYFNYLPLKIRHYSVALFVDDTQIYSEISTISKCMNIQSDLNYVYQWSEKRELKFNATECKVLTISKWKSPLLFKYKLSWWKFGKGNRLCWFGLTVNTNFNMFGKSYVMLTGNWVW